MRVRTANAHVQRASGRPGRAGRLDGVRQRRLYGGTDFFTRTSILDTRTWKLQSNLESYAITKDGRRYRAADVNFWGVTFADDTRFYATMATGGRTYLVRGDAATHTVRTLRDNVECPSLSPDGTRIVFKKRVIGSLARRALAAVRPRPADDARDTGGRTPQRR